MGQPSYTQLLKNDSSVTTYNNQENEIVAVEKKILEDNDINNEELKQVFKLVLVDIKNTTQYGIKTVKRNIYDGNDDDKTLNYIAICYRWGELEEQLVETPDYTACITSFTLIDLPIICHYIKREPDLKNIEYLWIDAISIDAISIDQKNYSKKKETILKTNQIYKRAAYILAIPDLHNGYLWKNPINIDVIGLVWKQRKLIYKNILNHHDHDQPITNSTQCNTNIHHHHHSFIQKFKNNENELKKENEELKKAYEFLAYVIEDWSNRAWVISEYQIAKEKYEKYGTPLKYILISLIHHYYNEEEEDKDDTEDVTFFSYSFDHHHHHQQYTNAKVNKNIIRYLDLDNHEKLIQFIKTRFTQRDHLHMILCSNASKNEDRFHVILPSWNKYKHLIENENTISDWSITDMTSVRLKLYEIMDDVWEKARLLYSCSYYPASLIFPSFASYCNGNYLTLPEKDDIDNAYKDYLKCLLNSEIIVNENRKEIEQYIIEENNGDKSIYTENLVHIQLNQNAKYLSIKPKVYFVHKYGATKTEFFCQVYLLKCSFKNDSNLKCVYIPFFTFTILGYNHVPPQL